MHTLDDDEHVLQLLLHATHDVPDRYVPLGHVDTHVLPYRYGRDDDDAQLVHVAEPLPAHSPHELSHVMHWLPSEYVPLGHVDAHTVELGRSRSGLTHEEHDDAPEHTLQPLRQLRHDDPLR